MVGCSTGVVIVTGVVTGTCPGSVVTGRTGMVVTSPEGESVGTIVEGVTGAEEDAPPVFPLSCSM